MGTEGKPISNTTETNNALLHFLKTHKNISMAVSFTGIIILYSVYSYLQEYLLADKDKKLNAAFVVASQSLIATTISAISKPMVMRVVLKVSY